MNSTFFHADFVFTGGNQNLEENPPNGKLLDRNHSVDVSRLSHANVPFVPRTFCLIYGELHIEQVGTLVATIVIGVNM